MTSSQHGPLTTWATHVLQWGATMGRQSVSWSQSHQTTPKFGLRAATRPHEAGIASNRASSRCGEYVLGLCTRSKGAWQAHTLDGESPSSV